MLFRLPALYSSRNGDLDPPGPRLHRLLRHGLRALPRSGGAHRHGGAVVGAIVGLVAAAQPRPGGALVAQQHEVEPAAVRAPVIAPQLERRLRAVVDRVEEVVAAPARQVLVADEEA